ncbi:uncharacterized protein LOC119837922 [Zerene cesonia]|uniref:uncharacterized protein LOC119837922 n=1 Tax=Zerene cesonia TaxID=33412 RepID=UPI0018E5181E|nr:uncharacterized protein LOC119837922 [Zerene cesonia]
MHTNVCKVCGGADMNLVDGFYYCVECGTQDQNIQERIVESAAFIGLYTKNAKSKIQNVEEKLNLGPEWCKWHAYNFIIAGLTDELIAAGAAPSVKQKILWIWTRYMKFFKTKDTRPKSQFFVNDDENNEECNEGTNHDDDNDNIGNVHETNDKGGNENTEELAESDVNDPNYEATSNVGGETCKTHDDDDDDSESNYSEDDKYADRRERMKSRIKHVTKGVIIAIFYIALNLDRSDIQLSWLLRYVRWRDVDFVTCTKYIPKDLDVTGIPRFSKFRISITRLYKQHTIRGIGLSLMYFLNLGLPIVPDFRKMINNYSKELCVPEDFKDLVLTLMSQYPNQRIQLSRYMHYAVKLPDYEAICLSYFVVAFKLCFGLDDEYERQVTNVVDKINDEKNLSKSYKISLSTNTDRMFSFIEWCEYIKLRKMIVGKHNLRMARLLKSDVNDFVFLEHLDKIKFKSSSLSSDIIKDMLNKIPLKTEMAVIPKDEFDVSFTPMASYTDVIIEYIQDPDLKLMLSEDFTQYSLEYAIKKLRLIENEDSKNIIRGVTKNNKLINKNISGNFSAPTGDDAKMVYIRFCERKDDASNLLRQLNGKGCENENLKIDSNDSYSTMPEEDNNGFQTVNNSKNYDTDNTKVINENNDKSKIEDEKSLILENDCRTITFVDYPNACIYDDDNKDDVKQAIAMMSESFGNLNDEGNFFDYITNNCLQSPQSNSPAAPNPSESVDRKTMINELIRRACSTYKIALPRPRKPKTMPNKDKNTPVKSRTKKGKYVPADYRSGIHMRKCESFIFMMLQSYYNNIQVQNNDNKDGNQEQNCINESVQENVEEASNHAECTSNAENGSDPIDSTADCVVQEDDDDNEMEQLLDADEEESEEEFILPETAQLNDEDISKLDEAADKILEKETARCGRPPKKKLKLNESTSKKTKDTKIENEKLLHPSAWGVKKFSYWIRHYSAQTQMQKSKDLHDTFNIELYNNLPKSFTFILHECGSIIDSTPFRLYKHIECLERHIMHKNRNKKTIIRRKRRSKKSVKK